MIPPSPALPPALQRFLRISTVLALLCIAMELFCHFVLGKTVSVHVPNIAYAWPVEWWNNCRDFWCWIVRFHHIHSVQFFSQDPSFEEAFTYPAPAALVLLCFYRIPGHPLIGFLVLSAIVLLFLMARFYRALVRSGLAVPAAISLVALTAVFSYPLWFEADLGNIELWIMFFLVAGIWAFLSGREYTAATFFALAAACKIFPFIFFTLFLTKKRWRPIVYGAALIMALNLIGLWVLDPNIPESYRELTRSIATYRINHFLTIHFETGFDHSLFGVIKVLYFVFLIKVRHIPLNFGDIPSGIVTLGTIYLPVVACAGLFLYWRYIRVAPVTNQIMALTIVAILFPPVSNDYTLLHLYIPWGILALIAVRHRRPIPGLVAAFTLFAILLAPLTEIIYRNVSLGGQIKSLALVALLFLTLRYPFPDLDQAAEPATA